MAARFVVLLCYVGECLKAGAAVESGIVWAAERDSLQLDLVVELHEGFGMALDGASVFGYLGRVLMLNDTQF